ncbi:MAG: AlkZ family DNA glycosylase [Candidatus Heimdallarchaeota archaeon]|nr:MAG: AlkZ family DNA glycosylase [Candidatus Heimdallarchaeota archaeon]
MMKITLKDANLLTLHKHHLMKVESRLQNIVKIVEDIGGLHATGTKVPYLSLFARTANFSVREELDEELFAKKNLGKIRCMRKTLFILPKDLIPIVFAATKETVLKTSKKYLEYRGISSDQYKEISKSIVNILKGEEMTSSEVKKNLQTKLNISAILNVMCDQGILLRSHPRKYSLFMDYFPEISLSNLNNQEAINLLVHQYLHSFAPVTEKDIIWWSGLTKTKIKEALSNLQGDLLNIEISDLPGNFILPHSDLKLLRGLNFSKSPVINLLPWLDPYLMGYKERDRYLDNKHYDMVFDRSGNATSTILLDGRVIGIWDYTTGSEATIKLFLFEESEEVRREIYTEAQRIGKFIAHKEVPIRQCDKMIPLPQRTAGSFMSPLKEC